MSLWETREHALESLESDLAQEGVVIEDAFALLDELITLLSTASSTSELARICAIVALKAKNLSLACYSLILDGLAQEAGTTFRVLIEALELLQYFRLDASRVNEVFEDELPSAGIIARRIDGSFQDLREYLNINSSHFGITYDAIRHLINPSANELQLWQPFREDVLRRNMVVIFSFLIIVISEATNCLFEATGSVDEDLADRVEALRARGSSILT